MKAFIIIAAAITLGFIFGRVYEKRQLEPVFETRISEAKQEAREETKKQSPIATREWMFNPDRKTPLDTRPVARH